MEGVPKQMFCSGHLCLPPLNKVSQTLDSATEMPLNPGFPSSGNVDTSFWAFLLASASRFPSAPPVWMFLPGDVCLPSAQHGAL